MFNYPLQSTFWMLFQHRKKIEEGGVFSAISGLLSAGSADPPAISVFLRYNSVETMPFHEGGGGFKIDFRIRGIEEYSICYLHISIILIIFSCGIASTNRISCIMEGYTLLMLYPTYSTFMYIPAYFTIIHLCQT